MWLTSRKQRAPRFANSPLSFRGPHAVAFVNVAFSVSCRRRSAGVSLLPAASNPPKHRRVCAINVFAEDVLCAEQESRPGVAIHLGLAAY